MILLLYAKFYIIRSQEVTNILRNGATNGDFRFFAFPGKFCFASITLFLFNTPERLLESLLASLFYEKRKGFVDSMK